VALVDDRDLARGRAVVAEAPHAFRVEAVDELGLGSDGDRHLGHEPGGAHGQDRRAVGGRVDA
jgi:hypothetical protein